MVACYIFTPHLDFTGYVEGKGGAPSYSSILRRAQRRLIGS